MKYKLLALFLSATTFSSGLATQSLDLVKLKIIEHQLDDVMEIIDTTLLKEKLKEVEHQFENEPTEINKLRLGIIYHETALNLSFLAKTKFKGYSKKSFDVLSDLNADSKTTKEMMPFITAYRASALALIGGETKKLGLVADAFTLFEASIRDYADVSYCPEFLRGSVAENLPWIFFTKRKYAKVDMQSILDKQDKDSDFANWKIMSFVYWSWANQHKSGKHKAQALLYLEKAIALDPKYKAGRKRAEELKAKMTK